jgi:CheY-like chemotaxis protein
MGADGRIGLEIVRRSRPDIVFFGYPRRKICSDELRTQARIHGITMVGAFLIDDEISGYQLAVNGYLSKPFDRDEIETTLARACKRHPDRVYIISGDRGDARFLQTLIGTRKHETRILPAVDAAVHTSPLPDIVVIDTCPEETVYRAVVSLRRHQNFRNIPIVLALDLPLRDVTCIGTSEYGKGLDDVRKYLDER